MQASEKQKQHAGKSAVAVPLQSSAIIRIACFTSLTLWQKEDQNLSENTQFTETPLSLQSYGNTASEPRFVRVLTDRIYFVTDGLFDLYKKRKVVFVCRGVRLEPCVVGRGGDGFHVNFNWAG